MDGIVNRRFGLRVLLGIVLGCVVGGALLVGLPTGLQPDDRVELTTATGRTHTLTFEASPSGGDAARVKAEPPLNGLPPEMKALGMPVEGFRKAVAEATAIAIPSARVVARGEVSVRPWPVEVLHVAGQLFLRLLRMLVVPLLLVTVLVGIASLGSISRLGRLGFQASFWMVGTMVVAVAIGLIAVNVVKPGAGLRGQWLVDGEGAADGQSVSELILRVVPTNPVKAIAELDVVGILFFVILLAVALLQIGPRRAAPVLGFFQSLNDAVAVMVGWVMVLAPFGIFALVAHTVATQEPSFLGPLLRSLGLFALTVTMGLAAHFAFQLAILAIVARVSPIRFLQRMGPALATAFGTNSSSATLPVTLRCAEEMGLPRRISAFVLPVGATLNMDGTALFEAVAAMFFAQAFGFDFGIGTQILVALTSVLAAMGAAGIPSAGLVTMVLVLSAVGLPTSKLPLLWAIDRPLDMMRTVVNVSGDALTCCILQRLNPDLSDPDGRDGADGEGEAEAAKALRD